MVKTVYWPLDAYESCGISMAENVAILGASANPARYAYKAQQALRANGHTPVPVNPKYALIDGIRCYPDLRSVSVKIDTITIYVRPDILYSIAGDIVAVRPDRVIFNPGSESSEVADRLESANIKVQNACTLVLLNAARF